MYDHDLSISDLLESLHPISFHISNFFFNISFSYLQVTNIDSFPEGCRKKRVPKNMFKRKKDTGKSSSRGKLPKLSLKVTVMFSNDNDACVDGARLQDQGSSSFVWSSAANFLLEGGSDLCRNFEPRIKNLLKYLEKIFLSIGQMLFVSDVSTYTKFCS